MFACAQCHKTFTRKDSLLRHIKTLHPSSDVREFSLNNSMNIQNQFGNTTSGHYLFDSLNKQIPNDIEHKTLSEQDNLSESIYDADDTGKNNTDEDISQIVEDNNENKVTKSKDELKMFDQRIQSATEAIKSKFDAIRKSKNIFQNYENKNSVPNNEEEGSFTNTTPENNNATSFQAKLPEFVQCLLDILMIKELQNVDITDKYDVENNNNNNNNNNDKNKGIQLKRPFRLENEEHNEDKTMSFEETPVKRFNYGKPMEYENGNNNNNSSKNSECFVRKYWHNPNTLVNKLRKLIETNEIGQQILTIIKSLNENNNVPHTSNYPTVDKQRNELIRELNELKKHNIGKQIFCIFQELANAEIIDSVDYITDQEEENNSDEEDDEDDNIIGNDGVTTGESLHIRPYNSIWA